MHCGLLRDCAGARKAKESSLWYEKKNLDYEERKKEEEWSTVLLSQMAWESCKAFSHLCSLRSGRKTGKFYIYIYVFIYIYIYRYICISGYCNALMICKSLSTLLTALHFIRKAETFESPPPYLIVLYFSKQKGIVPWPYQTGTGFSLDLFNGNILHLCSIF